MILKPLYVQAKRKNLGDLQINDVKTFRWICKNLKIKYLLKLRIKEINLIDIKFIKKLLPKNKWFVDKNRIDSIHGYLHTVRVMIILFLLCKIYNSNFTKNLIISASIHDIKRINDKDDKGHGVRAEKWFIKNLNNYFDYLNEKDSKMIQNLAKYHESKDNDIPLNIKDKYHKELLLLKTADALDRYRLPKKKWWPRKKYLKIKISKNLHIFSKLLFYYTEKERLINKQNTYNSIIKTLDKIVKKHGKN